MAGGSARLDDATGDPLAEIIMVANGVYARLSRELAEAEARVQARLDEIEAKLEARFDARFDALLERLSRPPAPRKDGQP